MYVQVSNELTLSDLNDDGKAVQSMGDGIIESAYSIHITGDVSIDSNEFAIQAGNSSETDTLKIDASITQTGKLNLKAGDHIIQNAEVITAGTLTLVADNENESTDTVRGGITQTNASITSTTVNLESYESIVMNNENNQIDILSATVEKGAFSYTENDSIQIDKITADQAINITSLSGAITDYQNDVEGDIISNSGIVSLTAASDIGGGDHEDVYLEISESTSFSAQSNQAGSINIKSSGALTLSYVSTTDGAIDILADGKITAENIISGDANDDEHHDISIKNTSGSVDLETITTDHLLTVSTKSEILSTSGKISGVAAILSASGGIGSSDDALTVNVGQLDISNRMSGDIYIHSTNDLSLIDLTDDSRAVNNFGGGHIQSDQNLTIAGEIHQSADFTLTAGVDLTLSSDIQHKAGGSINFHAANDILHTAGKVVSGSGSIQLIADKNQTGEGTIVQTGGEYKSTTLDIIASETVDLSAGSNDLEIIKATVNAGDFLYKEVNDISIDTIIASGNVTITSETGFIADASDDTEIDIHSGSGQVTLSAGSRIAGLEEGGDMYLEIAPGSSITANTSNIGHIFLRSFGDLTLTDVTTADGEIQVDTTGLIHAVNVASGDMGDNA
ncbi:MAG: hypothetical protein OMM_02943 [Candidatus Magnetoglobus multicellularis str. Araruama]|uniref:Uncharacterized protein n=1 Tax=Candidatus Magnetoglobus multicellularis str. Araruama TaxID=890399 RepID=A0A1V1P7V0_9BACT|nr:MAG: hypothetical protein OMM_02943 [Candidatus Magnetoglobus multicellularis str. Araruama]